MPIRILCFAAVAILLCSCTTSYSVGPGGQTTKEAIDWIQGNTVTVTLLDSSIYKGEVAESTPDTMVLITEWRSKVTESGEVTNVTNWEKENLSIPIQNVAHIRLKIKALGTVLGVLLGAPAGAYAVYAIHGPWHFDDPGPHFGPNLDGVVPVLAGAFLGGALGGIVGGALSPSIEYTFSDMHRMQDIAEERK